MEEKNKRLEKISVKKDILIPSVFCFISLLGSLLITIYADDLRELNVDPMITLLIINVIEFIILILLIVKLRTYRNKEQQYSDKEKQYSDKEKKLLILENECLYYENLLNKIKRAINSKEAQLAEVLTAIISHPSPDEAEYCLKNVSYDVFVDYNPDDECSDIFCIWNIQGYKNNEDEERSVYKIDLRGDSKVDDIKVLGIEVLLKINDHDFDVLALRGYESEKGYIIDYNGTSSQKKVLKIDFGRSLIKGDKFHLMIKYKWPSTYTNKGDRFTINPGTLYNYECEEMNVSIRSKIKCFECARLSSITEGTIEEKYTEKIDEEWRVDFINIRGIGKNLCSIETYR